MNIGLTDQLCPVSLKLIGAESGNKIHVVHKQTTAAYYQVQQMVKKLL